jgi:hypothetical protein
VLPAVLPKVARQEAPIRRHAFQLYQPQRHRLAAGPFAAVANQNPPARPSFDAAAAVADGTWSATCVASCCAPSPTSRSAPSWTTSQSATTATSRGCWQGRRAHAGAGRTTGGVQGSPDLWRCCLRDVDGNKGDDEADGDASAETREQEHMHVRVWDQSMRRPPRK